MASENHSPPPGCLAPDLRKTFLMHEELMVFIQSFASSAGFSVRDDPKEYFTAENWPFECPYTRMPRRGKIVCSPKSQGRPSRSSCPWKVAYLWVKNQNVFCWRPSSSYLCHRHGLALPMAIFDGRTEVKFEQHLTWGEHITYLSRKQSLCSGLL